MLLSFAQFEREVTEERIREQDRGFQTKGHVDGRYLTARLSSPRAQSGDRRRRSYRPRDLQPLSRTQVHELKDVLAAESIAPRASLRSTATPSFGRGALYHLLSNRIYVGDIVHKGEATCGQHPPIVDLALFETVQELLAATARSEETNHCQRPRAADRLQGSIVPVSASHPSPAASKMIDSIVIMFLQDLQQGQRPIDALRSWRRRSNVQS